jgi:hypothetical protein
MAGSGTMKCFMAAVLAFVGVATAIAADDIRTERVHFKKGANSAVVEGSIKGYQTVDYVLGAQKGQTMNVSMATKHGATYFNILAPGQNEVAMFNGSTSENQFEGVLPESGDYKIRVYMMRSAARRNEVAKYRLEMIISGAGEKPAAASGDAKVAGTNYHATGNIPCSMGGGQPTGSCPFGVTREGKGNGIVTVTKPDGRTRAIFFKNGRPTTSDASQADPGEFSASREGDLNIVRIGKERYEIPDAVILGG